MRRVVGICGAGVMGAAVAARLVRGGLRVITAGRGRSAESLDRAREAGMVDVETLDRVVEEADVIMSIMGSAAAGEFARELGSALERADRPRLLFAECNLISPEAMRGIAASLERPSIRVVDASVVGPPPDGVASPSFYFSGEHASELLFLSDYGFPVETVGREIGLASALKVCSAAVWQGCLALTLEVLMTAEHYGLEDQLLADLRRHQTLIHDWFVPAVLSAPPRARRWAADMRVVGEAMTDVGASGRYHHAAGDLYRRLADLPRRDWRSAEEISRALSHPT